MRANAKLCVWVVEAGSCNEGDHRLLGIYMSEKKAEQAASAAEASGIDNVSVDTVPANTRLWTRAGDALWQEVNHE